MEEVGRLRPFSGRTSETSPKDSAEDQTTVSISGEPLPTANASAANEFTPTHSNNTSSYSSLSKALTSIISSAIKDFDSQAEETVRSQDQLSFAIDRLTRELDALLEDAPSSPFIMQHAVKLSSIRKRVSSLNAVLKSIQRRVDNIDRLMSSVLKSMYHIMLLCLYACSICPNWLAML